MSYTPIYKALLETFNGLLEDENLDEGLDNEYVRGGIELIADFCGILMDERDVILNDLRSIRETA